MVNLSAFSSNLVAHGKSNGTPVFFRKKNYHEFMFIKITTDSKVNENDLNKQTYFRLKLNGLEREILHLNLSQ